MFKTLFGKLFKSVPKSLPVEDTSSKFTLEVERAECIMSTLGSYRYPSADYFIDAAGRRFPLLKNLLSTEVCVSNAETITQRVVQSRGDLTEVVLLDAENTNRSIEAPDEVFLVAITKDVLYVVAINAIKAGRVVRDAFTEEVYDQWGKYRIFKLFDAFYADKNINLGLISLISEIPVGEDEVLKGVHKIIDKCSRSEWGQLLNVMYDANYIYAFTEGKVDITQNISFINDLTTVSGFKLASLWDESVIETHRLLDGRIDYDKFRQVFSTAINDRILSDLVTKTTHTFTPRVPVSVTGNRTDVFWFARYLNTEEMAMTAMADLPAPLKVGCLETPSRIYDCIVLNNDGRYFYAHSLAIIEHSSRNHNFKQIGEFRTW